MKKINKIALISCLIVSAFACDEINNEDPTLSLEPSGMVLLPASGGTKEFKVTTNQKDWTVVSDKSWCQVKSKTGNNFVLEAAENLSTLNRDTAIVTISAGEAQPLTIRVSQLGSEPALSVSPTLSTIEFPAEITTESHVFTVISNESSWHARVPTVDSLWCKVTMNPSAKTFTIKPETNTTQTSRSAVVLVSGIQASSISITVKQKAKTQNSTDDFEYEEGTSWD